MRNRFNGEQKSQEFYLDKSRHDSTVVVNQLHQRTNGIIFKDQYMFTILFARYKLITWTKQVMYTVHSNCCYDQCNVYWRFVSLKILNNVTNYLIQNQ